MMNSSRFQITENIFDSVVYSMENQDEQLYLNISNGEFQNYDDDTSLIPLPEWNSNDGYRLMEHFTQMLPDTPFSRRLKDILSSGKGVFRRFKDTLQEKPELLDWWRRYKDYQMRKTAREWFSEWSQAIDLDSLDPEPEDWDDLPLSEFVFRQAEGDDMPVILRWHKEALEESPAEDPYAEQLSGIRAEPVRSEEIQVAETPMGELAGFAWIQLGDGEINPDGILRQLYVAPEYRRSGLGRSLMEHAFGTLSARGAVKLRVCLGEKGRLLESSLERAGFLPVMTLWVKSP